MSAVSGAAGSACSRLPGREDASVGSIGGGGGRDPRAELLDALNRVHRAARAGQRLPPAERAQVFECALMFEQERTVGPKVREEVAKFDCPVLTAIVLRPVVRFT